MAKNQISTLPLSMMEIVMRADAATIQAAYQARVKVDGLLAEREEAYRRIAELESQVDALFGEPGIFVFPDPPLPVAGFGTKQAKPAAAAPKKAAAKPNAEDADNAEENAEKADE